MKHKIIGFLMLGMISQTYAQQDVLFIAKLKKDEVPKVIKSSVDRDFSELNVIEYVAIPQKYTTPIMANKKIKTIEGHDSYLVTFEGKTEKIMATYNKEGQLISTVDHYKNKTVPRHIYSAVDKLYPEWEILDGYKKMSTYDKAGELNNEYFKLSLKFGEKTRKVYVNNDGNLVNSTGRIKM